MKIGSRSPMHVGEVDRARGLTAEVHDERRCPRSPSGTTSSRRWWTSASVASACGPVRRDTASRAPRCRPRSAAASLTDATPGVARSVVEQLRQRAAPTRLRSCRPRRGSGRWRPGPKPSAMRSYALCVVLAAGSLLASALPSRSDEHRQRDDDRARRSRRSRSGPGAAARSGPSGATCLRSVARACAGRP